MKSAAIPVLSLLVALPLQALPAPSLEDIVKTLEQVDKRIDVIKVEGYWHMYQWDDSTRSWKTTPESSTFGCAIENKQQGRYVFDQHPGIMRWTAGTAPFLASWSTQFRDSDGVITEWWYKPNQPYDGTEFLPNGLRCFNERADREKKAGFYHALAQRVEGIYSGLGFTGLWAIRNTPIHIPSRAKDFTVSESEDGMVRVRFSVAAMPVTWDYVLDPKKNFALVRYAYTQQHGYSYTDEVLEHRQIANGVWYPVHCTRTSKDSARNGKEELVLTSIEVLHGGDAETNLTVKLPDGITIRDLDEPAKNDRQGAPANGVSPAR
jgi:hypothetical protein